MKPKFLQNSKDMLSRSFNPAKCKTSLKLAAPRLKLLRNKKEVQLTQMKRDIARLLESGEDQTAQIRVEHVIKEEKLMAAYDLLEIYCELIIVRLPIIESQKNCPSDLKEAVTSLVFASLRCGDVPELLDVRKHFSAKYGKDFTKAAIELRPDCGVSHLLVQKLSAAATDAQTKTKVLSAIAKEHNVRWVPRLSPEKEPAPPSDLLNGSSDVGKENDHLAEPPHVEAANTQAHPNNSGQISGFNTELQDVTKPPELRDEQTDLLQGDTESIPLDKERWNVEFKDATSAAQAAAESAEQARIAAKSAVEFAKLSYVKTQNSQESLISENYSEKVDGSVTRVSSESSLNTGLSEETTGGDRLDQLETESNGLKKDPFDEDLHTPSEEYFHRQSPSESQKLTTDTSEPIGDHCYNQDSFEDVNEDYINTSEQLSKYEADTANVWPTQSGSFRDNKITEKEDSVGLAPPSPSISDDYNIFADIKDPSFNHNAGENVFLGNNVVETLGETSHDFSDAVYDKLESDADDDHGLFMDNTYGDLGPDIHHTASLGPNSQDHLDTKTDSLSPILTLSESVEPTPSPFLTTETSIDSFAEKLPEGNAPEVDNHVSLNFDVSDGESSETGEDDNKPEDSRNLPSAQIGSGDMSQSQHGVQVMDIHEGFSRFDRSQKPLSSDDELESGELYVDGGKAFFDSDDEMLSTVKDDDSEDESIPHGGNSLSFGKLTGGLRHKGYNRLSFLKNGLDLPPSETEAAKEKPGILTRSEEGTTTASTDAHTAELPKTSKKSDYGASIRKQSVPLELVSDGSDEEESLRTSSAYRRDHYSQTKPSFSEASKPTFNSDDSDSDEHAPKQQQQQHPLTGKKNHLRGGISRRTKAYPSGKGMNSFSKTRPKYEAPDFDEGPIDAKLTSSTSLKTSNESEPLRKSSDKLESYKQPTTEEVVASSSIESKFRPPPKMQRNSSKASDSDARHKAEPEKERFEPNRPNSVEDQDRPSVSTST